MRFRNTLTLRSAAALCAVALIAVLTFSSCNRRSDEQLEVVGQVEAVTVSAGSKVGGRVAEVLVEEGKRVAQGDVLVKIDDAEARAALLAAKAKLAQTEATLQKITAGARAEEIKRAEAAAEQARQRYQIAQQATREPELAAAIAMEDAARAQRDQAKADFDRIERLMQGEAVSRQRYDQAKHALDAAEANLQAAFQRRTLAKEGARSEEIAAAKAALDQAEAALEELKNGARPEDIDAAKAIRDAAAADVARAEVTLNEMTIISPREGVIDALDIHPGDLVKPGPVATVVAVDDLELMVYVSALMLGQLKLGQEVTLTADAHPGQTFQGTIVFISSAGEFTPRNLQTQEERAQQVFGVKIKLHSFEGRIRAGMSLTAHFPRTNGGA